MFHQVKHIDITKGFNTPDIFRQGILQPIFQEIFFRAGMDGENNRFSRFSECFNDRSQVHPVIGIARAVNRCHIIISFFKSQRG